MEHDILLVKKNEDGKIPKKLLPILEKSDIGLNLVNNFDIASEEEAEAGLAEDKYMTPLRVKQAVRSLAVAPAVGKGLSANDFTNELKAKVEAIPDNPKYTDNDTKYSAGSGLKLSGTEFNIKNELNNSNLKFWIGTESQYNSISTKDGSTLYMIKE